MPEHWIRLRGGWLWSLPEDDSTAVRRVSLPLDGPPRGASRIILSRRFGRPLINPLLERLSLRLEEVTGLAAIRLNGRSMDVPRAAIVNIELVWGELTPKGNWLILEVVSSPSPLAESDRSRWGTIALVVHQPDSTSGPDAAHRPDDGDPESGLEV